MKEQERGGHEENWYGNLKVESKMIRIEVSEKNVKGKLKSTWKREVKEKIREAAKKEMDEKIKKSKKLRFISGNSGWNTYLREVFNDTAREAVKIRLNMVDWIADNVGEKRPCPLCKQAMDTTEHVFECGRIGNSSPTVKDLEEGKRMAEMVDMFKSNELKRREQLTDNIMLKLDSFGSEEEPL